MFWRQVIKKRIEPGLAPSVYLVPPGMCFFYKDGGAPVATGSDRGGAYNRTCGVRRMTVVYWDRVVGAERHCGLSASAERRVAQRPAAAAGATGTVGGAGRTVRRGGVPAGAGGARECRSSGRLRASSWRWAP